MYLLLRYMKGKLCIVCNERYQQVYDKYCSICKSRKGIYKKRINMKRKYKIKSDRYYSIYKPHHKYSDKSGRVLEHRYIYHIYLSIKYNRVIYLPIKYDIHHKNKNPLDNRIQNLELLSKSKHKLMDSKAKNRVCNICNDKYKSYKKWHRDINGYLCTICYTMIRYYRIKFGFI